MKLLIFSFLFICLSERSTTDGKRERVKKEHKIINIKPHEKEKAADYTFLKELTSNSVSTSCGKTVTFDSYEPGNCVQSDGSMPSGYVFLSEGDAMYGPDESLIQSCFTLCSEAASKLSLEVTACEAIWSGDDRGCWAHTEPVSRTDGRDSSACAITATSREKNRQECVWHFISKIEDFKTNNVYSSETKDRKTLTTLRYAIQPIWWSDQDEKDPETWIDESIVNTNVLEEVRTIYLDMSYEKFEFSWFILPQRKISVASENPDWSDDTQNLALNMIESEGYVKGEDFDGVMMLYNLAQSGPFSGPGGWGSTHDFTLWMSVSKELDFDKGVLAHELGHTLGHNHHSSYGYFYRFTRPDYEDVGAYDGFDMMSNGEQSQFGVASQWFFNWIPNESIVLMQPEGATEQCPSCLSEGTFELHAFDNPGVKPSGVLMGLHIPIAAYVDDYDRTIIYAYWLSYRGISLGGVANVGISAHLAWFILEDGIDSGGLFDSMSFDAFGNTETTMDSFILPDTCYILSPTSFLKDKYDISVVAQVQPVVCTGSIVFGKRATITVSFIDELNSPSAQVDAINEKYACSELKDEISLALDLTKPRLIDVSNIGENGAINLSVCPGGDGSEVDVYFYDSYPYSFISYESFPGYSALKSMSSSSMQCCEAGSTISATGAKVVKITTNLVDHYLSLREMEIFDDLGINIASNARCYSKNHVWRNDGTECINDGDVTDSACHHFGIDYSFCVFENPVDIKSITIYPGYEGWWRLEDITIEIFADITGLKPYLTNAQDVISFIGPLASFDMSFGWDDVRYIDIGIDYVDPKEVSVTLNKNYSCPDSKPNADYTSDYGETWILISSERSSSNPSETMITLKCEDSSTSKPTPNPSKIPTAKPSKIFTDKPSKISTDKPSTSKSTVNPSKAPTVTPSQAPTAIFTKAPTISPSKISTDKPTKKPKKNKRNKKKRRKNKKKKSNKKKRALSTATV